MKRNIFLLFTLLLIESMSAQPINVMSFNIRYNEPRDKEQAWKHRKEIATQAIQFYETDIIGIQEALYSQVRYLNKQLSEHYDSYGVGRDNGFKAGEHMMVYYKKNRFTPIDKGTLWLSETPDTPSIGWDAACKRTLTWIIFYDRLAQKEVAFFNTHLDHKGTIAREEGSHRLMSFVQTIANGRPCILTGDFNATPTSNVIRIITDTSAPFSLRDTRTDAGTIYGPAWTYHGFGATALADRRIIDYIFHSGFTSISRFGVLAEQRDSVYLSDHCPILTQLIY